MRSIFIVVGWGLIALTSTARAEHLFVLRMADKGVTIEKMALPEGKELSLSCDPKGGMIDVIFPVGPGGSGSLARFSDERSITVKRVGQEISVLERAKNGKQWQRPVRTLSDLKEDDIRVSVISHEGMRKTFLIRRYNDVVADPVGLVVDLFAGKVPTHPGDYLIHTETTPSKTGDRMLGATPFEFSQYLFVRGKQSNGNEGTFVLDIGAGQTILARGFLPPDVTISDVGVAQYSSAGKEILKYAPQGATGTTQVLGGTTLPQLVLGGLTFRDVNVAVMAKLPNLGGRSIDGIIGLDLLRRNRFLTIDYGAGAIDEGMVRLDSNPSDFGETASTVPFAMINSHLIIETKVNTTPVAVILDTGSPVCFLDTQAATKSGLKFEETPAKSVQGLDAGSASVRTARIEEFKVADRAYSNVDAMVGSLPVFAPLHVHNQSVGLLGNSILSRMGRLEIDFETNQIRFAASNASAAPEKPNPNP